MENKQTSSFSVYELEKMASLIADSMAKIEKVLERLQRADDRKNALLLLQALDNLNRVNAKLLTLGKAKAKQQTKKAVEKTEEILSEKTGG